MNAQEKGHFRIAPSLSFGEHHMNRKDEIVSYREHFDDLLKADEKLQDERWDAHQEVHKMGQRAIDAAVEVLDSRLEQMNQFRAQVLEERREFMREEVYNVQNTALTSKFEGLIDRLAIRLTEVEKYKSNLEGRFWMLGAGLTIITVGLNLIFRYWGR